MPALVFLGALAWLPAGMAETADLPAGGLPESPAQAGGEPVLKTPAAVEKAALKGWADDVGPTGSITITRHINKARELSAKSPYYAKQHYRQAIELSPKSSDFIIEYYRLCWQTKDWSEVVSALDRLFKLDPAYDKQFGGQLGLALVECGKKERALAVLRKAAGGAASPDIAHEGLLRLYLGEGKREAAEREYREVLRLRPADADLHAEFAAYLWSGNRLSEAVPEYRAVARLKPDDAGAQAALAYALMNLRDYAGAYAAYRKAAELAPSVEQYRTSMNQAFQYKEAYAREARKKKK